MDKKSKIIKEQNLVEEMIRLYCRKQHKTSDLCPECQNLLDYSKQRTEKCPFIETKSFCANCKVHCYKKDMKKKISEAMRFSGPRMLLYHPSVAIWHVITSFKERRSI